jgi:hypothetical protein
MTQRDEVSTQTVPAVFIEHGIGKPRRKDVKAVPRMVEGMYVKVDDDLLCHAYLYAPEHADEAFDLLTRHWQEEQDLRNRHAKELNHLVPWRLKV